MPQPAIQILHTISKQILFWKLKLIIEGESEWEGCNGWGCVCVWRASDTVIVIRPTLISSGPSLSFGPWSIRWIKFIRDISGSRSLYFAPSVLRRYNRNSDDMQDRVLWWIWCLWRGNGTNKNIALSYQLNPANLMLNSHPTISLLVRRKPKGGLALSGMLTKPNKPSKCLFF